MQVVKTKTAVYKTPAKPPKPKDCPYCKSDLTATEKDFFPCSCTFQACVNCYEDIMNNKGLCPTCHKPLRVSKVKALHVSKKEELQKSEMEKLSKEKVQKKSTTITVVTTVSSRHPNTSSHTQTSKVDPRVHLPKMSFAELSKLRIIQRNLVYIIGLAPQIAKPEVLERVEYFGQYGKVNKVVVNKGNAYNSASPNGPSFSAYITFAREIDAAIAILAADQVIVFDRTLRTSYGTTKYCTFLLKGQSCPNSDCLYLHTVETREELLIKDEMASNKDIFMDQQKLTIDFIEKHSEEVLKKPNPDLKAKCVLPSLPTVQAKVKKLVDQRVKERREQEMLREKEIEQKEKPKSKIAEEESNKENIDTNLDSMHGSPKKSAVTSTQDIESAIDSLSPQKNERKDSKMEGTSEALQSNRSSSSNWSTTDNSLKKDIVSEHKEDTDVKSVTQTQPEQKGSEDGAGPLPVEELADDTQPKNIFVEMMEANCSSNRKDNPYKDGFDKDIYERITNNMHNQKSSRFQHIQEDDMTELNAINAKDKGYEEFSDISKAIMEFVVNDWTSESARHAVESKSSIATGNKGDSSEPEIKKHDLSSRFVAEEMSKNIASKSKSDKGKQIQKGDDINVNKSAEFSSMNKATDNGNNAAVTNTHARNKQLGHKMSSFK